MIPSPNRMFASSSILLAMKLHVCHGHARDSIESSEGFILSIMECYEFFMSLMNE